MKIQLIFILFFIGILKLIEAAPICIPEYPCTICDVAPTSCLACEKAHFLLGNECIPCTFPCVGCLSPNICYDCDLEFSGYFLYGNVCVPCSYPCLTCYAPTYCYTCGWDVERRIGDRYCKCQPQYFHYEQQCLVCEPPCIKCQSSTFCLDCDSNITGLYADYDTGACINCVYPCLTCTSANYCLTCGYDFEKRVNDYSCRCSPGWWDDGSECRACIAPCNDCDSETFCNHCDNENTGLYADTDGICKECYYPCITCLRPGHCLSCGWDIENRNIDTQCSCKQGFYSCGTKCKPCMPPCQICTSETNCLNCGNGQSGTFYYNNSCRPCEYPCENCISLTNCLTCGYEPEKREKNSTCSCLTGYYEMGYKCVECNPPCISCASFSICFDCNQMVSMTYLSEDQQCIQCPYPCILCRNASYCYSCGWDVENRIENSSCPCKPGLFENQQKCLGCSPPCVQCLESAINCLTCIEGTYLDNNRCLFCLYPCILCSTQTDCITCGWGPERRYAPVITSTYYYLGEKFHTYDIQTCLCLDGYYIEDRYCQPCELPCVTCTQKNVCLTYNCENQVSGKYLKNETEGCVLCNYPCKNCYNSYYCITCGYDIQNRNASYPCNCLDGYYEQDQQCLTCRPPCITCESETVCITLDCESDSSKLYYDIDQNKCLPCEYPCITCSSNSYNKCKTCGWDIENRKEAPSCQCKSGYYEEGQICRKCVLPCITCYNLTSCYSIICDNHNGQLTKMFQYGSSQCIHCKYPCDTCSSATNCTTCGYGPENRNPPSYYNCTCKSGFYEKNQECLKCQYPCKYCTSQTECTSYENCNWVSSQMYLVGTNSCKACPYPCKTCTIKNDSDFHYGICQICGYGASRRVTPYSIYKCYRYYYNYWYYYKSCDEYRYYWYRYCECKPGFYEEDQQCKPCKLPCLHCTSLTQCTTYFDCNYTYSGLYKNSNNECVACNYPCKLCTVDNGNNCTACGWDLENRNPPSSKCSCKSGYYHNLVDKACYQCKMPCITCTSASNCLTTYDCEKTTSGFYPLNNTCKSCEFPCKTCYNKTYCYSCGYDPDKRNDPPGCQCKSGTFALGEKCIDCIPPCLTCLSETQCITKTQLDCQTAVSRQYPSVNSCVPCVYPCDLCTSQYTCLKCKGQMANRESTPSCKCISGYYDLNQICMKCSPPCLTCASSTQCITSTCYTDISGQYQQDDTCHTCIYPCITCISSTQCIKCEWEIENRNNNPSCECKNGYYPDAQKQCQKCQIPCINCSSLSTCTSYLPCMPGEYRSGKYCVKCQYPCLTCSSSVYCTGTCGYLYGDNQSRYQVGVYVKYRYIYDCRCSIGYYHHSILQRCFKCIQPCVECTDSQTCTKVNDCNYTVSGFYAGETECLPCQYPCLTCNEYSTNCYSCGYGGNSVRNYPNKYNRKCNCQSTFYENNQECKKCVLPCVTCSSLNVCKTYNCQNEESGLYWNKQQHKCMPCQFPCLTCRDNQPTSCLTCGYGGHTVRYEPTSNDSQCACRSGYYTFEKECLKCQLPCITCTSLTECTSMDCKNQLSGLYWDSTEKKCIPCQYPCITCYDYYPKKCYQCGYNPELRNQGSSYSYCKCKTKYYEDLLLQTCLPCQLPCVTCSNLNTCITHECNNQTRGFYWDSTEKKCKKCQYPCETCKDDAPNKCESCGYEPQFRYSIDYYYYSKKCQCKYGYYDEEQQCKKCVLPCLSCIDLNTCINKTCDNDNTRLYWDGTECKKCVYPCYTCKNGPKDCKTCINDVENRKNIPDCSCKDGFFEKNQKCLKCVKPCGNCSSEKNCITYDCSSEFSGLYLYHPPDEGLWVPENCDQLPYIEQLEVKCKIIQARCIPCEYPCLTCDTISNCLSCGYTPIKRSLSNGCTCVNGTYHNQDDQTCIQNDCLYPCVTCNLQIGNRACTSCPDGRYLSGNSCTLCDNTRCKTCNQDQSCITCTDSYFLQDGTCQPCQYPCITCLTKTFCLSCGDDYEVRQPPPNCNCLFDYTDKNNSCIKCIAPCQECTDTNTNSCISCISGFHIQGTVCINCPIACDTCTSQEICQTCSVGYYHNGITCQLCQYPCETCYNQTYCYTCFQSDKMIHPPSCKCKNEYYDSLTYDIGCIICTSPCSQCTQDTTNCQACINGYYLKTITIPDGEDQLGVQQYKQQGYCIQCKNGCSICDGEVTCQKCKEGYFYKDNDCHACLYPCATCMQDQIGDYCLTCGYQPSKRMHPPQCNCLPSLKDTYDPILGCIVCSLGYFLEGIVCKQCPENCESCSTFNNCITCKDNYFLENQICKPCIYPCVNCLTKNLCKTCGFGEDNRLKEPYCICNTEQYSDSLDELLGCVQCIQPCKTCTNKTITSCKTCILGYYILGTKCIKCPKGCYSCINPTNCNVCNNGYYLNDSLCLKCVYPCKTCLNETFCYSCGYGPEKRLQPPTCECDSQDRQLYDNKRQGCSDPPSPILAWDEASKIPYLCEQNYTLTMLGTKKTISVTPKIIEDGEEVNGQTIDVEVEEAECTPTCKEGASECIKQEQDCQDGYYRDGNICKKCQSPCATCLNSKFCYTCGFDPTNQRIKPPTCACIETLSDHGDRCDTCTAPCQTCTSFSITDCLTCNDYYYIDSGECKPCHISCLQCTGPLEVDCSFNNFYSCRPQYYHKDGKCVACEYPCKTCTQAKYCLTCGFDTANRFEPPSCNCKNEYTDDGEICLLCEKPCLICTKTVSTCITCIKGYYLVNQSCFQCEPNCLRCINSASECQICKDTYYLDQNDSLCKICVYPCINCYDIDKCITCGFEPEKRKEPPSCECLIQYQQHNQTCIQCHNLCRTCDGLTENDCLTCNIGYYLNNTQCIQCPEACDSCLSPTKCNGCNDGWYIKTDGETCEKCKAPCATCWSDTDCKTCGFSPQKRGNPPQCACKAQYTPIGLEICDFCTAPCLQCTTILDTDCLTCIEGWYMIGSGPQSCIECSDPCNRCLTDLICIDCIDGYYFQENSIEPENQCLQCIYPCQTCYSSKYCKDCGYNPEKRGDAPFCLCDQGLMDIGNDCGQCSTPCQECYGLGSSDCLSCYDGEFLLGNQCLNCQQGCAICKNTKNECYLCLDNYYQDGTQCIQCNYPCLNCYSASQCITCQYDIDKRRAPPTCLCFIDKYSDYEAETQCIICTSPCYWCDSPANNDCTKCVPGYYLIGKECLECKEGCSECDTTDKTICSKCFDGYFWKDDTCNKCDSPCQTCLFSSKNCLTCGYGPEKRITPPLCDCLDDFDDATTECVICQTPCKKCFGALSTQCLTCIYGYIWNTSTKECDPCQQGCAICTLEDKSFCFKCMDEYYLDGETCKSCKYPCQNCLNETYCYTCGYDLTDPKRRIRPPSCMCNIQYSDNGNACIQCVDPCKTCQTTSNTDCYTCIKGYYLQGDGSTFSPCIKCEFMCSQCTAQTICQECIDGYYLSENNLCLKCKYPCETCLKPSFCYTCGIDIEKRLPPPTCKCLRRYSDSYDESQGCIVCTSPCLTCNSLLNNDCNSCVDDYYLVGTECKNCDISCNKCTSLTNCQECNYGYYLDGELCLTCPHPCKHCQDNSGRCIDCVDGTNRQIPPKCGCLNFFYDDGSSHDCIKCPIPGGICSSPTEYTTCAQGYFWGNKQVKSKIIYKLVSVKIEQQVIDEEATKILDGEDGELGNSDIIVYKTVLVDGEDYYDGETVYLYDIDCISCPSQCKTCQRADFCYECSSTLNRGAAPWCQCIEGYYHDGIDCQQCPFPSSICNSETEFVFCQNGYYIKGTQCIQCSFPCLNCIIDYNCLTCGWDVENRKDIPQCTCLIGQYDEKNELGEWTKQCKVCPEPSVTCLSASIHYSCIDGYYLNDINNFCTKCMYPCINCETDTYCLTCGFFPSQRENPPSCSCMFGIYYQKNVSDGECTKCSENSANCLECISYDHCLSCQDGFTLEGIVCVPCPEECVTCIGKVCLTCGLEIEGNNTPSCDCLGEIDNSGTYKECYETSCPALPCIAPCQNCRSIDECITCVPGLYRNQAPDCSCIDGFKDNLLDKCVIDCPDGEYGVGEKCFKCNYPCETCNGTPDKCLSCQIGFKLYGNNICVTFCQFPCRDCIINQPFTCTMCSGLYRSIDNNCGCQDTYFEYNNLCYKCIHPCKNCIDATTCTSCIDGENRQGTDGECQCAEGYKEYQKICIQICEDGYYQNYTTCIKCDPQCKTCEGSGYNCLQCSYGYYKNGLTCQNCPVNCTNCQFDIATSQINCMKCDEKAIGRQQILPCECNDGYFERGTIDCGQCIPPCVNCENSRIECLSCIEDGLNRKLPPDCNCLDNFYEKDGTCILCDYMCETCVQIETQCLSCYTGITGRSINLPDCECEDGYYDVGVLECNQCEYPCDTCINLSTYCITCQFPLEGRHSPPNCNCLDGEYKDCDNHCLPCDWRCKTCEIEKTQCLTCIEENRKASDCNCKEGYFGLDEGWSGFYPVPVCNECHKICKTCELIPENCITCYDNINRQSAPSCQCIIGFYQDQSDKICKKCTYPCDECSDIETCISCSQIIDLNRKELVDNCQCKEGFYSNKINKCDQCEVFCKECTEQNWKCTLCHDSIQDVQNKCQCPQTYYFDEIQKKCLKCVDPCYTCSSIDICLDCDENSNRQLIDNKCTCKDQYFENKQENNECQKCHISCNNCINEPNNCKLCTQGFFQEKFDQDTQILNCTSCGLYGAQICQKSLETGLIQADQCLFGYYKQQYKQNSSIFYCEPDCKQVYNTNCQTCDYQKCLNCEENKNYFQICEKDNQECKEQDNCKLCQVEFCQKCSKNYQICEQCINTYILNSKKQICKKEILSQEVQNSCNPRSIEMISLKCKTCDIFTKQCISCYIDQNRALNNGKCECDVFYKETQNGDCIQDSKSIITEDILKNLKEYRIHVIIGILISGIIANPTFLIHLLDTLQMIKYTLYLQIDFPTIIYKYFEFLSMYESEFLPQIVPLNQNQMSTPQGFSKNNIDGFLLRNLSPFLLMLIGLAILYSFLLIIKKICFSTKNQNKKKSKIQQYFEDLVLMIKTDVFVTVLLQSFLKTVISCILQLNALEMQNNVSIFSKILSFVLLIIELSLPFLIINGAGNYLVKKRKKEKLKNNKTVISPYSSTLYKQFTQKKKNNILSTGYFAIICIRKIFFSFSLVYLNNQPLITIIIFIIMNFSMIIYSLKYNPFYKKKRSRFFDALSELFYAGIYVSSFIFQIGDSEDKDRRYQVAYILIICATSIQLLETLNFLIEILHIMILGLISLCIKKKEKKKEKKKKKKKNQIHDQNEILNSEINLEDKIKDQNQIDIVPLEKEIKSQNQKKYEQLMQETLTQEQKLIQNQQNISLNTNKYNIISIVENSKTNLKNEINSQNKIETQNNSDTNIIDKNQLSVVKIQQKDSSLEQIINTSTQNYIKSSPVFQKKIKENKNYNKKEFSQQKNVVKPVKIDIFTMGNADLNSLSDNIKKNLQQIEYQKKLLLFQQMENFQNQNKKKKKRNRNRKNDKNLSQKDDIQNIQQQEQEAISNQNINNQVQNQNQQIQNQQQNDQEILQNKTYLDEQNNDLIDKVELL